MSVRRSAAAVACLTVLLTTAACGSSSGEAGSGTSGDSTATAATTTSAATSESATESTTTGSAAPAGPMELTAGKRCQIIDEAVATELTGTAPTGSDAGTTAESSEGTTKLDGCRFTGTRPTLTYEVTEFTTAPIAAIMAKGKAAAMARAGATDLDVDLGDSSYGVVSSLGQISMARVEFSEGKVLVQVTAIGQDADKAGEVATASAERIAAALG